MSLSGFFLVFTTCLGLVLFGWLLYFCSRFCAILSEKQSGTDRIKTISEGKEDINAKLPSYDQIVVEDKNSLPTFQEALHM